MFKIDMSNRLKEIYEARVGKITEVYQQHKKNPQDKRLFCSIELFPGGVYENVPFWGGSIDTNTGFPHGAFFAPRIDQLILILFIGGHFENPLACLPISQPTKPLDKQKYYNILDSIDDMALCHYSGTRITLKSDGSVIINKKDETLNNQLKIEFEKTGIILKKIITDLNNNNIIELTSTGINVNGSTDSAVKGDNLFNALNTLSTAITSLTAGTTPAELKANIQGIQAAFSSFLTTISAPATAIKSEKVKIG